MVKLPRTLQETHVFEKDDIWYAANLQTGKVLEIDAVTADILDLCSTCDNAGILEKLGDRYAETDIFKSLKALGGDIETLLFEHEQNQVLISEKKLRIFIPHGFMKHKSILSPTTNVGIYNLLIALAKRAEVFVEIDSDDSATEQREQMKSLGIEFASEMFKSKEFHMYAGNRFVVNDTNGILALSPHPYTELNYFRYNSIPVVSRVYSDRNLWESTTNKLLSHLALRRSFDSVCADTPWTNGALEVPKSFARGGLTTIPNAVDTAIYTPQDQQQARAGVAELVGEKSIRNAPVVGILNGFQPQNGLGMIETLARLHKDVVFIVFDSVLQRANYQHPRNVFYISLNCPEDTVALPWIYSACEFIIFPTVIGTPFSMVLEAFACGVPGIALNSTTLDKELAKGLVSVPLSQDDTTGKYMIPTAAISTQIDRLLCASDLRETLSTQAMQIAGKYSPERTAERFLSLFTELNRKKTEDPTPKYANVAFAPYYDRAQNVARMGAMQLDGFLKQRVEDGLAQTLLSEHTLEEVRTVLRYLLGDWEKADRLLSTLSSNY